MYRARTAGASASRTAHEMDLALPPCWRNVMLDEGCASVFRRWLSQNTKALRRGPIG